VKKKISIVLAIIGVVLVYLSISTMDYCTQYTTDDIPTYLYWMLYGGVSMMIPAFLYLMMKGE
jgi:uncharacterized membrane protein